MPQQQQKQRPYSLFTPPSLSMSELSVKVLDHEQTDLLIDKWLEHPGANTVHGSYSEWFRGVKSSACQKKQLLAFSRGAFLPENVFSRTVDTGRLIPIDRAWTTHIYHHKSIQDRKLPMLPVIFTMLPELLILHGMHEHLEDIYVIVVDMKRQEMDDLTEYFKLVCGQAFGRTCSPKVARQIQYEHMRLSHTLGRQRRYPCLAQIDIALRALLYEKRPPFIVLFSHQPSAYSQILFTDSLFVPDEDIYYDFPSGCPNAANSSCCTDCEIIRFPRRGPEGATVLRIKRGGKFGPRIKKSREMCNWVQCNVSFNSDIQEAPATAPTASSSSSDNSETSQSSVVEVDGGSNPRPVGQLCSKCKLVKYCCVEHQRADWNEHRRICVKPTPVPPPAVAT